MSEKKIKYLLHLLRIVMASILGGIIGYFLCAGLYLFSVWLHSQ
jgi:membrane protein YqaA with SNARE-associated domain